MSAVALPVNPRARRAYAALRALLPAELAARAVHDLEQAQDQRVRASVLAALPELPIYEHQAWLEQHGYANCCRDCHRELRPRESISFDPLTLRASCSDCRFRTTHPEDSCPT